jgi:hypothetical protein
MGTVMSAASRRQARDQYEQSDQPSEIHMANSFRKYQGSPAPCGRVYAVTEKVCAGTGESQRASRCFAIFLEADRKAVRTTPDRQRQERMPIR